MLVKLEPNFIQALKNQDMFLVDGPRYNNTDWGTFYLVYKNEVESLFNCKDWSRFLKMTDYSDSIVNNMKNDKLQWYRMKNHPFDTIRGYSIKCL